MYTSGTTGTPKARAGVVGGKRWVAACKTGGCLQDGWLLARLLFHCARTRLVVHAAGIAELHGGDGMLAGLQHSHSRAPGALCN